VERLQGVMEHLDGPLGDPAVLRGNLRDLGRINRLTGGVDLSRRALAGLLAETGGPRRAEAAASRAMGPAGNPGGAGAADSIRLLDVGTGAADIPVALLADADESRTDLEVVAVDSRQEVLEVARALDRRRAGRRRLSFLMADGRALPFEDGAFDVAHASLVLHHLDPDDARQMLREMRRMARRGVVINDLARGRLPLMLAWLALHGITRNPFTLHDGPLSVRRAYTPAEATGLLGDAGLTVVRLERGLFGHRWALAAVPT
jgi:SAM-dependent methyltransferase